MELWRYYRILRRRKWLIVIGMLVCILSVFVHNLTTPPQYVGRVRVMERQPAQRGVPVYGDYYGGGSSLETHLNDLAVIATSDKIFTQAASTLTLLNITLDPQALLRTVKVEVVPQSEVLEIKVISSNRDEAKAAADVIAREFKDVYKGIMHEPTKKSKEFIYSQREDARKQLEKVREQVRKFKDQNGIVQLGSQTEIALQRSAQFRNQLTNAEVGESQATAQVGVALDQMKAIPKLRRSAESVSQNPLYINLKQQLNDAETEMARLMQEHYSEYPPVKELQKRIDEITAKLADPKMMLMTDSGHSTQPNPIYDTLSQRYMNAMADRESAVAQKSALSAAVAAVQPTLDKVPAQEQMLAQLMVDQQAKEQTYQLLSQKFAEAQIKENESEKANAIMVVDEASWSPVDQKKSLKLGLAVMLSPMLAMALIFLLNYLDNSIKTPSEAEELLALPVFAVVPLSRSHSLARHKNTGALAEIYQILSANLWGNMDVSNEGACIAIASAEPDTGRSITASNLAITLAADGARVVLVDADFRQPVQHTIFGVDNRHGLSNVLGGGALIEEIMRPTKFEGLLLMTSGPVPDNPVRLLRSPQMKSFIEQIKTVADYVIFDTPAGVSFADAGIIASQTKNVVIVHAAGKVPRGAEAEFRNRLEQFGAHFVGAVLNKVSPDESHGYYHYRRAYQDTLPPSSGRPTLTGSGRPRAISSQPPKPGGDAA